LRFSILLWLALFMPLTPVVAAGEESTPALDVVLADRVLVIAHRGASGTAPENTLPAFRRAVEMGVDLVELDYYHTSDGVPVVFHDKDLKRTTDARAVLGDDAGSIASLTLEQARRLDVGRWFGPEFAGTRILTLEEALDAIQPGSMTLIERKEGDARTCIELLRRKKLLDRVVVQAFDWDFLADCRRLAPNLALGALGDKELTADRLAKLDRLGVQAVGWSHKHLTHADIVALHNRGFRVWCYTVNEEARAAELLAAGVDGLITDFPERLKSLVAEAGQSPAR
jgi:glycerophosphoryl diester phosphodiesterase